MNEKSVIAHIFNGRAEYGISKEESEANAALICEAKQLFYNVKGFIHNVEAMGLQEKFSNVYSQAKAILNRICGK